MNKTARMTILMTPKMKKEASHIFGKIGMSSATAFRMLMRYAIDHKSCPCDLFEPNEKTLQAIKDCDEGINLTSTTLEELRREYK